MLPDERLRIFFDADALIAGAASRKGASHLLLRLSDLGLVRGLTCAQVLAEAEGNLGRKLPAALPVFQAIVVSAALTVVPDAPPTSLGRFQTWAHEGDIHILAAAIEAESDYLVTFNVRHYRVPSGHLRVARPGEVVARMRRSLAALT